MPTFVSTHTDLASILSEFHGLRSENSIHDLYHSALTAHEKAPLGLSDKAAFKNAADTFDLPSDKMRFSLPSTFDVSNDADLFWIKRAGNTIWKNLRNELMCTKPKTAMLFAPVVWQLGPLFFKECDDLNITSCTFDTPNPASADLVLKNHPIDFLVTTSKALQTLIELNAQIPAQVMVVEAFGPMPFLLRPDNTSVSYDIHLSPGVSIAFARGHKQGETFTFTPNEDYMFIVDGNAAHLTALTHNAPKLFHYQLPKLLTVVSSDNAKLTYVQ